MDSEHDIRQTAKQGADIETLDSLNPTASVVNRGPIRILVAGFTLVFLAIITGAAYMIFRPPPALDERVLVVTRTNLTGPQYLSDRLGLASRFATALRQAGFDAQTTSLLDLPASAQHAATEALRKLAAETQAAHVLVLDVQITPERPGLVRDSHLYRGLLRTELVSIDPGEAMASAALEFTYEHRLPLDMWRDVEDAWVKGLIPEVVNQLYNTRSVENLLRADVSMNSIQYSHQLRLGLPFVQRRRDLVSRWETYCQGERSRLGTLRDGADGVNVSCVGDPCAQWALLAVNDNGTTAYVQDVSRKPLFTLDVDDRMSWLEPPEAIRAVHLGTGDSRVIYRAGHFYGIGSTNAPSTHFGAMTYGAENSAGLISIALENGATKNVSIVTSRTRANPVIPSLDGTQLIAANGTGEWLAFHGADKITLPAFHGALWTKDSTGQELIVGDDDAGALIFSRADGSQDGPALEVPLEERESITEIVKAPEEGLFVFSQDRDGCSLRTMDAARALSAPVRLPVCIHAPQVLADGRVVGTAEIAEEGDIDGDPEIVVLSTDASRVRALTRGGHIEELPRVSRDGRTVVFNRRLSNWPSDLDLNIYRRVVCSAPIPTDSAPR